MVSSPSGRRGSSLLGRAHHQGGWGRLSDDRPGQHNPDSSEDPWGGGLPTLHGGASARNRPDTERDIRGYDGMHEGRKQTNTWSAYAGSRLELSDALGRRRPKRHPSSRTGENPPYGMIGGIEETSASFEARSAPRSYPTIGYAAHGVAGLHGESAALPTGEPPMSIEIIPTGAALGAEIRGVDLARPIDEMFAAIERLQ